VAPVTSTRQAEGSDAGAVAMPHRTCPLSRNGFSCQDPQALVVDALGPGVGEVLEPVAHLLAAGLVAQRRGMAGNE